MSIAVIAHRIAAAQPRLTDLGLLLMRLAFGGMLLVGHGWGKLMNFPGGAAEFPDPLGIGHTASMTGAVFGEAVCSFLVILGLATRLACVPVVFTFAVAALFVHGGDPFFMSGQGGAKEPALLYLAAFAVLLLLGPGRYSIDRAITRRLMRSGR